MKVVCAWCEEEGRPAVVREKEAVEAQATLVRRAIRVKRY